MDNYYASSLSHSPSTTLLKNNFPKYKNCRFNSSSTTVFSSLKFNQPCSQRTPSSFFFLELSNENLSYLVSKTNSSGRGNLSFLLSDRTSNSLVVRAVAENADNENAAIKSKWAATLQLGAMFGVWYSLNIYFNIFNKQVLKVFPYPATLTAVQFGCGTMMVLCMWGLNLYPRPNIKRSQVAPILILAFIHTIGNVLTNISLGKVAVSFTHTIKAMEPFFTVIFSVLFLSERPTLWVFSSLVPIVAGVALASSTEASFNWVGFSTAMASNVTNQSRNVLSKKFMIRKEDGMDNINLFSLIAMLSFTLMVPIAIITEGVRFTPAYLQQYTTSQGLNLKDLCLKALLSGICFHSYQQISYMILQMVSPMTHAVGNCLKRVVVIVSSVIFFQTPVSPVNSLGTGLALAGVFLYSRAKQMKPKKPKIV